MDMFAGQDAGKGEQFMAVKPWIGAVVEPASHPDPNPEKPNACLNLAFIYGYRCADSRQNVFFNSSGKVAYMTASVGVVMDYSSGNLTQKFFGGKLQPKMKHKAYQDDTNQHTNNILGLAISADRT